MAVGCFGGTALVWLKGLKPPQAFSLGGMHTTVHIALQALIVKVLVELAHLMLPRPAARASQTADGRPAFR